MQKNQKKKPQQPEFKKIDVLTGLIDYKNPEIIRKFLSQRYKLLPRKLTGLTAKKQRILERELKRSRIMALLPFSDIHANHS